jgi:hypothetical protein
MLAREILNLFKANSLHCKFTSQLLLAPRQAWHQRATVTFLDDCPEYFTGHTP